MKLKNVSVITLGVAMTLGMASCKKEEIKTNTSLNNSQANSTEKTEEWEAGIRSNFGYPVTEQTTMQYYKLHGNSMGQAADYLYNYFGGTATSLDPSGPKGYGAAGSSQVFLFKRNGVTYINALMADVASGDVILTLADGSFFNSTVEEIEIHPVTQEVYAIVRGYGSIQIHKINTTTGVVTPMTVNGSTTVFANTGKGNYKSGSICFLPDPVDTRNTVMAFTFESSTYSSLGIVTWFFDVDNVANTLGRRISDLDKSFTGLPYPQQGQINTTFDTEYGILYYAKEGIPTENGKLYTLNYQVIGGPGGISSTNTVVANRNDFGFWENF